MEPIVVLDVGSKLPLGELWGTPIGTTIIFIAVVFAIGLWSRSMAIGSYGAFLTFVFFATETDIAVLEPLLYVSLAMVIIGVGFKLWRLEGLGGAGA